MGQNNDPTERGDLQGQQGAQPKLSPEERKRQSGYPTLTRGEEYKSEALKGEGKAIPRQ